MKSLKLSLCLTFVLVLWVSLSAQERTASSEQLGQVDFPVACRAEVQPDFNRAVALLHSFWLDAASKAFNGVAERDPSCAMAYWGVP